MLESGFNMKEEYVEWKGNDDETNRVTFRAMKQTSQRDHTGVDVIREDFTGKFTFTSTRKTTVQQIYFT